MGSFHFFNTSSRVLLLLALLGVAVAMFGVVALTQHSRLGAFDATSYLQTAAGFNRGFLLRGLETGYRKSMVRARLRPETLTLNSYWKRSDGTVADTLMNMYTRIGEGTSVDDNPCIYATSAGEVVGNSSGESPPARSSPRGCVKRCTSGRSSGTGWRVRKRCFCRSVGANLNPRSGGTRKRQRKDPSLAELRRNLASPPIVFADDGTITAQTSGILKKDNLPPFQDAYSTWSDKWRAYLDVGESVFKRGTDLVQCSTVENFAVRCTVDPSLSAPRVRLEVTRTVTPFRLGGTRAPEKSQEPFEGIMRASIVVNTSDLRASSSEACFASLPTPSPTQTPTPTPSPLITTPPTISPTFTPAPTPTGGDSSGDDIFWED